MNRAAKQAAEAKVARRTKLLGRARRIGIWVVVVVIVFVVANLVFGDDGNPPETTLGVLAFLA